MRTKSDLFEICLRRDTTPSSVQWTVIIVYVLVIRFGKWGRSSTGSGLVWERDTTLQSVRWIVIIVLTWLSGLGREDEVRLCPRLVWEGIQHPWPVRRIVIINCLLWAGLGSEDEVRLVRDLFEKGYNPLIRPVRNISESIEVQFNLALSQLISVVSTHIRVTINYDASYDHSRYQTRCVELLFRQLEPLTYDVSLMTSRGQNGFLIRFGIRYSVHGNEFFSADNFREESYCDT